LKKVLFIDSIHSVLNERLEKYGFECIDGTKFSLEEIKVLLSEIFGIIIRARFTMNEEFLASKSS
jgi:D-3-phosphoglycerate dehydrogenase